MFNGTLLDFFWTLLLIYIWIAVFWMFISVFADIFRRENLSGWGKAGWLILIVLMPFLGILIYMIARPKMTEQDKRIIAEIDQQQRRMAGTSAADEIAKAVELKDKGAITEEEFQSLKAAALA